MIYLPKISPIHFKQVTANSASLDLGKHFKGVDNLDYCKEFPYATPFYFQFFSDTDTVTVTIGGSFFARTDITPVGWDGLGNFVFVVEMDIAEIGTHTIIIEEGVGNITYFKSENIKIVEDLSDFIEVEYSNSENDYGYVSDSNPLKIWFKGEYQNVLPSNELTVYDSDRGIPTMLRATPTEGYEFNIYEVPYYVINMLNLIFSCDTITVDGERFQSSENISPERIENTNIFNCTIPITRVEDEYQVSSVADDGIVFISDDVDEITSDDLNETLF